MSPVAPSGSHAGRALAVTTIAIVLLMGGLLLASVALSNRKSPDLNIGDQTFHAGLTSRLAPEIEKRGPIVFSDVSGARDRDMILQHLGNDQAKGWHAFAATPIDKPRSCTWQWSRTGRRFRAKCDRSLTAPADGRGLPQFKVTVHDGRVDVDLNAEARRTTTTAKRNG